MKQVKKFEVMRKRGKETRRIFNHLPPKKMEKPESKRSGKEIRIKPIKACVTSSAGVNLAVSGLPQAEMSSQD